MLNNFTVNTEKKGSVLRLNFVGDINEYSDFNQIDLSDSEEVIFDFSGVRFVNSIGLRGWILWVKKIKDKRVTFEGCPRYVVDQMNILDGFLPPQALVGSFFVPYYCDACDHTELYLAHRGVDFQEGTADQIEKINMADKRKCPQCGAPAELDVLGERYFNFLKYRK